MKVLFKDFGGSFGGAIGSVSILI